ncbi:MAG: T9SS type A sorting domain-containing protein, partial [Ignavibacteriaceae bacterium]|nr:T9SS type A sorting domain-containing protein [Ignavibacteriaceae bacterium]
QNYPNPFNPSTEIKFAIPQIANVTLKVFDVLGREVVTLVDEQMEAGKHSLIFNAANLSSGVYYYTIITEYFIQTKKMLLLK